MKKIIIFLLITAFLVFSFCACSEESQKQLTLVKVNEVTHSVFYAPMYSAVALGYFEDEGLEIELTNGGGADKVVAAVLSGDADIGLCGPEATFYVYNQGNDDYPLTFAQLTQCDGSFLLSREPIENFDISMLKGAHIIVGRKGGMPVMVLEWILRQNGLTPGSDVNVDTSIAFNAMAGAFIGGTADYVSLFEPTATALQNEGQGYIVMSLGEMSGNVPYTAFNAKKSYIENNKKTVEGFTRAIEKAQKYVQENSAEKIAETIIDFFPDTNINDITNAIANYKGINAYAPTTTFSEESFELLQKIITAAGELEIPVEYDKLVYTEFMY